MRSYGIGPNFRGVKMIPPGIHLVTYGTSLEKVGVFLRFGPGEVHVLEWDPKTEMITNDRALNSWQSREQRKGYEINVKV